MLDRLEAAKRRWESIRPDPGTQIDTRKAEELSLWLEQDICRVVEDFVDRPNFREAARWPVERLGSETMCEERRLVTDVDSCLIKSAAALVAFARQPFVWGQLLKADLSEERLPGGSAGGGDCPETDATGAPVPRGFSAIESIAGRPWHDLVRMHDYFHPTGDLNLIARRRSRDRLRPARCYPAPRDSGPRIVEGFAPSTPPE